MLPDDPEVRLSRTENEEQLREYAALGNWKAVNVLLQAGINPNASNAMNSCNVSQRHENPTLPDNLTGLEPSLPFQPSYLRNPDLAKQWGLPEGVRPLTGSRTHVAEPVTETLTLDTLVSAADQKADAPLSERIRPSPDPSSVSGGSSVDAVASPAKTDQVELVVYSEGLQPDNVRGAVFVPSTMALQGLVRVIREELDDIPDEFKLYRQCNNLEIPIGVRQYTAPVGQHFGSLQGVVIIKAKPA
ncbi:hypothetical protein H4R34_004094 [Dimargaris verticillata]|uniref:Uncharacterized protein n=1 Tax=Dimargaris verticillata TaxID=2761393 RepID=A0A9W8AZL9_9FUNG|nr:hypothetical protein H4R34_004094 [Dimargaris verticillata]